MTEAWVPEGVLRSPRAGQAVVTAKRVRAYHNGKAVAASTEAAILFDDLKPVTYAFPRDAVEGQAIDGPEQHPWGTRRPWVHEGTRIGWLYEDGVAKGRVSLDWLAMDAWFEESEEVFIHPRDPQSRIDVLRSDRHIRIMRDGHVLADTHAPVILIEMPGVLPMRYYIPPADVDRAILEPSETVTGCPYKGWADYHHVRIGDTVHRDLVWRYKAPVDGVQAIRGMFCFFNERADVFVDGEQQVPPDTPWRKSKR